MKNEMTATVHRYGYLIDPKIWAATTVNNVRFELKLEEPCGDDLWLKTKTKAKIKTDLPAHMYALSIIAGNYRDFGVLPSLIETIILSPAEELEKLTKPYPRLCAYLTSKSLAPLPGNRLEIIMVCKTMVVIDSPQD